MRLRTVAKLGMVLSVVLFCTAVGFYGFDSKVYSGYALGMGIERITNLKYRVNDLRLFSENDTRFLKEFEAAN